MIATYLQRLAQRCESTIDESSKSYLEFALQGGRRLQTLVDDLLLQAHVENSPRSEELVSIGDVVDEVCLELANPIRESGAQVQKGELPMLRAEKMLIRQLLYNLISNAIKFRRAGVTPTIAISAVREDGAWRIAVSDNGIGIGSDSLTRIFGHFQRLHPQDVYPGSGLGLALCKRIVELHGGKIWAESAEGNGSTFSFTLKRTLEPALSGTEIAATGSH
jgi:light-regulated signal transduction histidine kinase (bacteriophytochrome)